MLSTSRNVTVKRLLLVIGSVALAGWSVKAWIAPARFSPHRRFFATCDAIEPGAETADVLRSMRGYVLAGRRGNRDVTDAVVQSGARPAPEKDGEASFLFYPNHADIADWCVVYFRNDRVVRKALLPD
jgi:hypothetical protein